jgi:twitching motility protein PilI
MIVDYFKVELAQSRLLAIALERTAEVLTLQRSEICPVPGVKSELLGVSNQRGKLLWFVDLSSLLKITPPSPHLSRQKKVTAIVLTSENQKIAGVVSSLKGIITLDSQEFHPHPHPNCLAKTTFDSAPLAILDVDTLFKTLLLAENSKPLVTVN